MYVHKTVQRKLSWVILLCLNHIAGGVQFLSPGCDMYTFPLGGGASTGSWGQIGRPQAHS